MVRGGHGIINRSEAEPPQIPRAECCRALRARGAFPEPARACMPSREMLSGMSSESTTPWTKRSHSGSSVTFSLLLSIITWWFEWVIAWAELRASAGGD